MGNTENTIQEKIGRAFHQFGNNIAAEQGEDRITYEELDVKSTQFAGMLKAKKACRNKITGILLNNRIDFILSVVSVLKAGGIFMPLDVNHPEKRLRGMLEVAGADYIISDKENLRRALDLSDDGGRVILLDRDEIPDFAGKSYDFSLYSPEDPIYIFFTSGTTGKPKAILGKNKSLLHFVNWEADFLHLQEGVRISQLTSPGFDAILRDIFTPLAVGGTVCAPLSRETILDVNRLGNWIDREEINVVHCTPTLFGNISAGISDDRYRSLKYVILAGERIIPGALRNWYRVFSDRIQLINMYGPSETTMVKTFYEIKPSDAFRSSIPIGRPMDGVRLHILDERMKSCEAGAEGEIYLETEYMTYGYYKNASLNKEKFLPVAAENGDVKYAYRTGDFGRRSKDGFVEYLGRKDRQVKIRGNRIELGEIENILLQYNGIHQCHVHCFEDGDRTEEAKYCKVCGITQAYKGVTIDERGICNICGEYEVYRETINEYFRPLGELKEKIQSAGAAERGQYDCLLLYSGGKDSTYVLYQLVDMGFRVLAFVFDNGYISEVALDNIRKSAAEYNVDYVIKTREDMKDIFRAGLKDNCSVCEGCFKVLRALSTRLACEKGIKYIVNGLSRGQILDTRLYDILKQGAGTAKEIEDRIFHQRCLYFAKKDYITQALPADQSIDRSVLSKVELIDFYRYCDITRDGILDFLKQKNVLWNQPGNTGFCSSNCMINDVGIYLQRKYYGYDNYTFPNSWEVRLGHISLEHSLAEAKQEIDYARVENILHDIGYEEALEDKKDKGSNKYLMAYYTAGRQLEEKELYDYVRDLLPEAAIPSGFIYLEQLPVTINGKIDTGALPGKKEQLNRSYTALQDEAEVKISEIWSEILGRGHFGRDDNFLTAGGQSLQIMTLISKINECFSVEIPLEEIFNNASIGNIAAYIRSHKSVECGIAQPAGQKEYYALSPQQLGVYMAELSQDCGTAYNIISAVKITGPLDVGRLERAVNALLQRHEILRTAYTIRNGEPVQIIHDVPPLNLTVIDAVEDASGDMLQACIKPFDLARAPLIRAVLFRYSPEKGVLYLDTHHIATDGLSVRILLDDLIRFYAGDSMEELSIQYKDYAQWKLEHKEDLDAKGKFWLEMFKGCKAGGGFPVDHSVESNQVYGGSDMDTEIDSQILSRLNQISAEKKVTLFMVFFAAFHILYAKYSALDDVTVGTPLDVRNNYGLFDMVGDFANVVAIRSRPGADKPFADYLTEMRQVMIAALRNSDYPVSSLSKHLFENRAVKVDSLFDAAFTMFYQNEGGVSPEGISFELINDITSMERYKLRAIVSVSGQKAGLKIKYAGKMFEEPTIKRISEDYIRILGNISKDTAASIGDIAIDREEIDDMNEPFSDLGFSFT